MVFRPHVGLNAFTAGRPPGVNVFSCPVPSYKTDSLDIGMVADEIDCIVSTMDNLELVENEFFFPFFFGIRDPLT